MWVRSVRSVPLVQGLASFGFAGWPPIFDREPRLAIEPHGARMQGYGKSVERVFEPDILADRTNCIKEALGCFAPQSFGNGKNQVVGSIGRATQRA